MSSIKSAIKKYTKSHTLADEIGGFIINKTGYANRYMSTINAMYKTYTKINKKFKPVLESINVEQYDCKDMSNTVWICWLQGIDNAPELVKHCYESVRYNVKDREIIVITKDNFSSYTSLPDYIIEKWEKGIITNTLFSDLIRINLLNRHGGLWLDATAYLTDDIPDYITSSDFFVYRNGWFNFDMINMGNWLIYSKPNNRLLLETEKLLFEYWKTHNFIRQYFIFHIFFRMVTDKYPQLWNEVPYYNQIDQHIFIQEINRKYDEKRFEQIKAITPIHKLTNKLGDIEFEDDSYYSKLSELYKIKD